MKEADFLDAMVSNIKNGSLADPDAGQYAGIGDGRPAIIAGAGPSLPDDLRRLIDAIDKVPQFDLFVVGAAYKQVLAAGLSPDFLVTCDPSPATLAQFDCGPGLTPDDEAPLIYEASSCPELLSRELSCRTLISCGLENGSFAPIWMALGRAGVPAWGTVLSVALGVVHLWRYDPVVFIGADLSFPSGGDTHTPLAPGNARIDPAELPIAEQPRASYDPAGRRVITTQRLRQYAEHLFAQCQSEAELCGTRHYNATAGGVFNIDRRDIVSALQGPETVAPVLDTASAWFDTPGAVELAIRNLRRLRFVIEATQPEAFLDPSARHLMADIWLPVWGVRREELNHLVARKMREDALRVVAEAKGIICTTISELVGILGGRAYTTGCRQRNATAQAARSVVNG